MSDSKWDARVRSRLADVIDGGRWRSPRQFDARGPAGALSDVRDQGGGVGPVVSFASNDYLGLSVHPAVTAAAGEALERWGAGSGASRLITGSRPVHFALERALAEWKGTEAAVCFPTGFAANLGVLATLGGPDVRILSDELNHASIIDGCRLSRSWVGIYRHCDMSHLEALLEANDASTATVVVTDTVFSMDGDVAPIERIAELCASYGALLVVDEAHAVLGPVFGGGIDRVEDGLTLVRVGTLSKTLGSMGGFVAASRNVIDLLVNLARPYIFTTALTPADAAAALAAVEVVQSNEGRELTARLAALVERVAGPGHPSPIIPVILGSEERAQHASAALLEDGLWVPAIRPPTVPVGTSRLRVTLSAAHSDDEVARLCAALAPFRASGPAASGSPSPTARAGAVR